MHWAAGMFARAFVYSGLWLALLSPPLVAWVLLDQLPESATSDSPAMAPPPEPMPSIVLWAWERPEDLRSIPIDRSGIAWLSQTLILRAGGLERRPRRQRLDAPAGAKLLPVTRIEVEPGLTLPPDSPLLEALAEKIAPANAPPSALQLDFDARRSQRAFYRALLDRVRARMAPGGFLSITALVSWTGKRSWLRGAPVDEVVPMCFGPNTREELAERLQSEEPLAMGARSALGRWLGELIPGLPAVERTYLFSPRAWNEARVEQALGEAAP